MNAVIKVKRDRCHRIGFEKYVIRNKCVLYELYHEFNGPHTNYHQNI